MKTIAMNALHPWALAFIVLLHSGLALADQPPASSVPTADLLQPAELAATLKSTSAPKPLILHVGFQKLYAQAHIPQSEYVGAAGEDAGRQRLHQRVQHLAKDTSIAVAVPGATALTSPPPMRRCIRFGSLR